MFQILTAIAGILFFSAGAAFCETYTMETYYPAPVGVYTNMTVTSTTVLARDGGAMVGIGTANPKAKLDVNGVIRVGIAVEGAVCTGVGLIAVNSSGDILSCKSNVWKTGTTSMPKAWRDVIGKSNTCGATVANDKLTVPGRGDFAYSPNSAGSSASKVHFPGNYYAILAGNGFIVWWAGGTGWCCGLAGVGNLNYCAFN